MSTQVWWKKERCFNACKFSNQASNNFIILLHVFLMNIYEWLPVDETCLPEKEEFYSDLNFEDITEADYAHTK